MRIILSIFILLSQINKNLGSVEKIKPHNIFLAKSEKILTIQSNWAVKMNQFDYLEAFKFVVL